MEEKFDFSQALDALKLGNFVRRRGWNGADQSVFLKRNLSTDVGTPTVPYLILINAQRDLVPWIPSTGDLLAEDWRVLPNVEPAEPAVNA